MKISFLILFFLFLSSISISTGKVVLVLGGGGARGIAHIGVIGELERMGIEIDGVVGTSIGAIIGAAYAYGMEPDDMMDLVRIFVDSGDVKPLVDTDGALKRGALIPSKKLEELLRKIFGRIRIEDLKKEFRCVAYDAKNLKKVVFKSGDLVKAIMASSAYPGVIEPVIMNGEILIDGGLVDNLPIDVAKKMGGDFIIVSDISSGLIWQIPMDYLEKMEDFEPFVLKVIKSIRIPQVSGTILDEVYGSVLNALKLREYSMIPDYDDADIVIRPFMDVKAGTWDFKPYNSYYLLGEIAVERERERMVSYRRGELN